MIQQFKESIEKAGKLQLENQKLCLQITDLQQVKQSSSNHMEALKKENRELKKLIDKTRRETERTRLTTSTSTTVPAATTTTTTTTNQQGPTNNGGFEMKPADIAILQELSFFKNKV